MGFWIFMLITSLLIPFIMVGFGKYFSNNAPKEINSVFGYRTSMSMKNKDTWEFAHHYCGKLWLTIGRIMLILTVLTMGLVIGKDERVVGTFGGIVTWIQIVFLIGSIFPTERALRDNFDKQGNRRK